MDLGWFDWCLFGLVLMVDGVFVVTWFVGDLCGEWTGLYGLAHNNFSKSGYFRLETDFWIPKPK